MKRHPSHLHTLYHAVLSPALSCTHNLTLFCCDLLYVCDLRAFYSVPGCEWRSIIFLLGEVSYLSARRLELKRTQRQALLERGRHTRPSKGRGAEPPSLMPLVVQKIISCGRLGPHWNSDNQGPFHRVMSQC